MDIDDEVENQIVSAMENTVIANVPGAGQKLGDVTKMTFEQIRADLVATYTDFNPDLARSLQMCTNANEVWSTLNQRETRPRDEEDAKESLKFIKHMKDSGMMEKYRQEMQEKYTIIDPETNAPVFADLNNPQHFALLQEKLDVFVRKAHTSEQEDRMRKASRYQLLEADDIDPPSLTEQEAEEYKKTRKLPEEYVKARDERISRQQAMVKTVLSNFNGIVTASPQDICIVQLKASSVEFSNMATKFFPLQVGVLENALTRHGKETRTALITCNLYPTLLFESKLRLIIFGQKTFRVATSYQYHEWIHAMFMDVLSSDIRPHHKKFLQEERKVCQKLMQSAKEEEERYKKWLEEGENVTEESAQKAKENVERTLQDVAFYARSVALATKSLQEGKIVSPFKEYETRKNNAWRPYQVARHSKEEIAEIVRNLGEIERHTFNTRLTEIETQFKQGSLNTEDFLRKFWSLNHISTVEAVKRYEVGLFLLYEMAIPSDFRVDYSMRADVVSCVPGLVQNDVAKRLSKEREFFLSVRSCCASITKKLLTQQGKANQITSNGVQLDLSSITDAEAPVDVQQAMSPSFRAMYDFYNLITTDYGSVENMGIFVDQIDRVHRAIYDERGNLMNNYQTTLQTLALQSESENASSMLDGKRRRK